MPRQASKPPHLAKPETRPNAPNPSARPAHHPRVLPSHGVLPSAPASPPCAMTLDNKKWRPTLNTIDSSFYGHAKAASTAATPTMTAFEAPTTGAEAVAPSAETQKSHGEMTANRPSSAPETQDPLLTRLFLTPLLCISFLLSLLLVDSRNHERESDHSASSRTSYIFGLPWVRKEGETWVWRSRRRKIVRAEMGQAFEVRKWVLGGLVVGGVVAVGAGLLLMRWVWGRVGSYTLGGRLGWA